MLILSYAILPIFVILSLAMAAIFMIPMKRFFDTFATPRIFPFGKSSAIGMAFIQIWVMVCAFFLGSPIFSSLFSFDFHNPQDQVLFVSMVSIIVSVLRLLNIIHKTAADQDAPVINYDVVIWCIAAVGVLFFVLFTRPDALITNLSIVINNGAQFQSMTIMIVVCALLAAFATEGIGWLYNRITRRVTPTP